MHADARVEIGVPDGERMHARPGVHLDADAKRMRHGVRAHCLQHLRQLVGELRKIEMTVGIDEHGIARKSGPCIRYESQRARSSDRQRRASLR